jgi:lipoprotein signal peptidase
MNDAARYIAAWAVAVAASVADVASKLGVEAALLPGEGRVITPFLNFFHAQNRGVSFGMFASEGARTGLILLTIGALVLMAVLMHRAKAWAPAVGFALIMGGAAGNLVDRVRQGFVTDFIDVHAGSLHWYVFNLADAFIAVGVGLLLIHEWRAGRAAKRSSLAS